MNYSSEKNRPSSARSVKSLSFVILEINNLYLFFPLPAGGPPPPPLPFRDVSAVDVSVFVGSPTDFAVRVVVSVVSSAPEDGAVTSRRTV